MVETRSLNKIFGISDSNIAEMKKLSDEVQFQGNKVKDFNEEELRIAIGCLAKLLRWEQERILSKVLFSHATLEIINFNPTLLEIK